MEEVFWRMGGESIVGSILANKFIRDEQIVNTISCKQMRRRENPPPLCTRQLRLLVLRLFGNRE